MFFLKAALLASTFTAAVAASAIAQQVKDIDGLGCWETETRTVPRQGTFHVGFCFLKGGTIHGVSLHGVSANEFAPKWRRLDQGHVEIDGQTCALKRSKDGATLQISGCPDYARDWFKADPRKLLPLP